MVLDVIIIGGGPAGLSAALILGRCLRKVVVFDTGQPRNIKSNAMHGFLSQDCINPIEFLRISREQLEPYKVDILDKAVVSATKLEDNTFEVKDSTGKFYYSKTILIATGLIDALPEIKGIEKFYGKSVFHCPYCDGWEVRFKPIAVYGTTVSGSGLAAALGTWTDDIVLLTDGKTLTSEEIEMMKLKDIVINSKKIKCLNGSGGMLESIVFEDGSELERSAMFFSTEKFQRSGIAKDLGCEFTDKGLVKADFKQQTCVPGVFVAGDAARDMQLVIIAAAEGAKAGVTINQMLLKEESQFKKPLLHVG